MSPSGTLDNENFPGHDSLQLPRKRPPSKGGSGITVLVGVITLIHSTTPIPMSFFFLAMGIVIIATTITCDVIFQAKLVKSGTRSRVKHERYWEVWFRVHGKLFELIHQVLGLGRFGKLQH